jgi:hypothetical protein
MIANNNKSEVLTMLAAASYPSAKGNGLSNACYI